jgi:hypothetical protein
MTAFAAGCPYLAGCHPHRHTWIHPHHASNLGGLLFILLAIIIGHRITDGEWG